MFFGKSEGSDCEDDEGREPCGLTQTRSSSVIKFAVIKWTDVDRERESGATTVRSEETGSPPTLRSEVGLQFVITRYCLVNDEASALIRTKTGCSPFNIQLLHCFELM